MLHKLWLELRSSLWFVPGALVLAAIVLALSLVEVDIVFATELGAKSWSPLLNAGADGSRGVLAAIAGSMITVAGTAFSITIVALSLASTQYTPRILRNFMRDRGNQTVLGVFVGVFTYCLIVLRTIRGTDGTPQTFVPLLAVFCAVVLAMVAVGFLIYFIHHIASSIQAASILEAITRETLDSAETLFPEEIGEEDEDWSAVGQRLAGITWHPVQARSFGYLQSVDNGRLLSFAREHKLILKMERAVGNFVVDGAPIVSGDRSLQEDEANSARSFFVIGDFRTVEQDVSFGVRQIVDIAMKALSPGINDTSTAVSCLDYLSVILSRLARRRFEAPLREEDGQLRVIAAAPGFAELTASAFDEIRLSAAGNVSIFLHMLCALQRIGFATENNARRTILISHARLIASAASRTVREPYDRQRIDAELDDARKTLRATNENLPPLGSECPQNS